MATSRPQHEFLPSELFFLAEDEPVQIIPRQSMDSLQLIGFTLPKLTAMRPVSVPLWVALLLKKQGRVSIRPPEWLSEPELKKSYDAEKKNSAFSELPWHWLEISQAILAGAPEDLNASIPTIRALLRDIREIRQAKVRQGIEELNESHMQMNNLGHMELNELRPFITQVMDELRKVQAAARVEDEEED